MVEKFVGDLQVVMGRIVGSRKATNILMSVSIALASIIILGMGVLALNPLGGETIDWRASYFAGQSS